MLSSTNDAISVRDTLLIGGVSVWPGVAAGAMAHGGVSICPGVHGGAARLEMATTNVSTTAAARLLAFFMFFSLRSIGWCYRFFLEMNKMKQGFRRSVTFV